MNTIDVNPNRFLRHWLVSAIGAWPVAAVACLIAWLPVAILSAVFSQYASLDLLARILLITGFLTIPGAIIGLVIGDLQHALLRDLLHWDFEKWIKYSVIGGLFGGLLVITLNYAFAVSIPEPWQWIMALPVYIFPISVLQWWILRAEARHAWMWILANIVGAIVFGGLAFNTQPVFTNIPQPVITALIWAVAIASPGIITGIVMLWLYERPAPVQDEEDQEYAPVYLEVHNRDDR